MPGAALTIPIRAVNLTGRAFAAVSSGAVRMQRTMATVSAGMVRAFGAVSIAVLGVAASMAKVTTSVDNVAKTARKLGTSVATLQQLQFAAEQSGVSTDTFNMALQRMVRRVSEAARGTGEAKGALAELNLNARELAQLPLDQQLGVIADSFGNVTSEADRVRLAMKLFDSEGVALVNTLDMGSAGLAEMSARAKELGLNMSDIEAAEFEQLADQTNELKRAFGGLTSGVATVMVPAFQTLTQMFTDQLTGGMGDAREAGRQLGIRIVEVFGFIGDIVHSTIGLFKQFKIGVYFVADAFVDLVEFGIRPFISAYNALAETLGLESIANPVTQASDSIQQALETARLELLEFRQAALPSEQADSFLSRMASDAAQAAIAIREAGNATTEVEEKLTYFKKVQMDMAQQLGEFNAKMRTEQTQDVVNNLASQTSAVANSSKKMFAIDKGVRIAQAIMNTYTGATQALAAYPPPINAILAAMTVATGMAQVAQIRSQRYSPSFLGGGYTGMGARVGGVDGMGGFPAILHPNETVIDHEKGGAPVTVNVNISAADTKDFDRLLFERRSTLVTLINQAVNNRGRAAIA